MSMQAHYISALKEIQFIGLEKKIQDIGGKSIALVPELIALWVDTFFVQKNFQNVSTNIPI